MSSPSQCRGCRTLAFFASALLHAGIAGAVLWAAAQMVPTTDDDEGRSVGISLAMFDLDSPRGESSPPAAPPTDQPGDGETAVTEGPLEPPALDQAVQPQDTEEEQPRATDTSAPARTASKSDLPPRHLPNEPPMEQKAEPAMVAAAAVASGGAAMMTSPPAPPVETPQPTKQRNNVASAKDGDTKQAPVTDKAPDETQDETQDTRSSPRTASSAPRTTKPAVKLETKPKQKTKPKPKSKAKNRSKSKTRSDQKRKSKPKSTDKARARKAPKRSKSTPDKIAKQSPGGEDSTPARRKSKQAGKRGNDKAEGTGKGSKSGKGKQSGKKATARSKAAKKKAESRYLSELRRAIQRRKYYPKTARKRGMEGTVRVQLTIHANGKFSGIRVGASSGSKELDKAAMVAIKRLGHFKPIPKAVGRSRWTVRVPITYKLR